ncbi:hypothetical protein ALC53_05288 [Atta colombica]|uniref:Uncharacterized protein n=1 Tax=Atta colombica TaxID=520822 RepID=A0A195BJC7_9HYME|nr:hypothetical protein ALC53_05288 [Atta colombica]
MTLSLCMRDPSVCGSSGSPYLLTLRSTCNVLAVLRAVGRYSSVFTVECVRSPFGRRFLLLACFKIGKQRGHCILKDTPLSIIQETNEKRQSISKDVLMKLGTSLSIFEIWKGTKNSATIIVTRDNRIFNSSPITPYLGCKVQFYRRFATEVSRKPIMALEEVSGSVEYPFMTGNVG